MSLAPHRIAGRAFATVTDENGSFRFTSVPVRKYAAIAEKAGYSRGSYQHVINVVAGQDVEGLVIQLDVSSRLQGAVLDVDRKPVAGARILALLSHFRRGIQQFLPVDGAVTDQSGHYILEKVRPGSYYLLAIPSESSGVGGFARGAARVIEARTKRPVGNVATYYPGVTSLGAAGAIELNPGADLVGIDFSLVRSKVFEVNGSIPDPGNKASLQVEVSSAEDNLVVTTPLAYVSVGPPDYRFHFSLAPGEYTLRLVDPLQPTTYGGARQVAIGDRDINDAQVPAANAGTIDGKIRVEGQENQANTDVRGLGRISLEAVPIDSFPLRHPVTRVYDDGHFELAGVWKGRFEVDVKQLAADEYVEQMQWNGREFASFLDLREGARGSLEILIGSPGAQVSGTIWDSSESVRVQRATVLLIRKDLNFSGVQTVSSDVNGSFQIPSISPGAYLLYGWQNVSRDALEDPKFLAASANHAVALDLGRGDSRFIDLRVAP